MRKFFSLSVLLVMALSVFVSWKILSFTYSPMSEESQENIFVIKPGSSFQSVSKKLFQQGFIKSEFLFKVLGRLRGAGNKIKVGEFALNLNYSPAKILDILMSGESIQYPFTIQEGLNMYEIAQMFEQGGFGSSQEFLRLCKDVDFIQSLIGEKIESLEGYLFPETYKLTKFTGEKKLIQLMVENFLKTYKVVSQGAIRPMPRHQAIILASIIEKETGAPLERAMISSVFHNRLKKGMRLQSDPTILYGLMDQSGKMQNNISKKDILTPTRFNTYTVKALPAGPISNPGAEAIRATLNPKDSEFLYFVSQNDGTHVFSKTYKEHNNAVRKYQLDKKMRQGKSWRDLGKKLNKTQKK